MSLYNLENVNRCKLFTELYDSCIDLEYSYREPRNKDPFHLLIISVMNYDVVITYLPSEIIGNVKYSKDITLTEFRRRKVYSSVVEKIKYWVKIIEKYTVTSAGKMKFRYLYDYEYRQNMIRYTAKNGMEEAIILKLGIMEIQQIFI